MLDLHRLHTDIDTSIMLFFRSSFELNWILARCSLLHLLHWRYTGTSSPMGCPVIECSEPCLAGRYWWLHPPRMPLIMSERRPQDRLFWLGRVCRTVRLCSHSDPSKHSNAMTAHSFSISSRHNHHKPHLKCSKCRLAFYSVTSLRIHMQSSHSY
jgi:hypothetical protein